MSRKKFSAYFKKGEITINRPLHKGTLEAATKEVIQLIAEESFPKDESIEIYSLVPNGEWTQESSVMVLSKGE